MSGEDLNLLAVILGRETSGDHLAPLGEQTWTYGALLAATEQLA
jgi:hypothetical protein